MTGASAQQPPAQPPALPAAASGGHFRHLLVAGPAGRTGIADITDVCHALPDAPAT